jgi:hypothetical protein
MEKREESVFCGHANTDNLVAAHLLAPVLALVSKILMRFSRRGTRYLTQIYVV